MLDLPTPTDRPDDAPPAEPEAIYEALRAQFDGTPYPWVPMDWTVDQKPDLLYYHSLVSAFYARDRRVIATEGKRILDVGCGTGFKALVLASLNPGTQVLGVDLSPRSIAIAQERVAAHGLTDRVEFRTLNLESLSPADGTFDYINCDEVLYLLSSPLAGLRAMASVLHPEGMVRVNLHSALQRSTVYQAQQALEILGLRRPNLDREGIDRVETTVNAWNPNLLVSRSWSPYRNLAREDRDEVLTSNFLLQGDRGFTVPQTFDLLGAAGLEFVRVLRPELWKFEDLFSQPLEEQPEFLQGAIAGLSERDRLTLYELLKPDNRLIDLWCGLPGAATPSPAPATWQDAQWERSRIALHPLLQTPAFYTALQDHCRNLKPLNFTPFLVLPRGIAAASSLNLPALLPLIQGPASLADLVESTRQVRPLDPVDLTPVDLVVLRQTVQEFLLTLEGIGYITIELV